MIVLQTKRIKDEKWVHRLVATFKQGKKQKKQTSPWVDTMVPVMMGVGDTTYVAFGAPWEGTGLKTLQVYALTEVDESTVEVIKDDDKNKVHKRQRGAGNKKEDKRSTA